ncbi:MAG: trypsin-like peptidase domain-containing protein [Candidatus Marinimicrobia bacterium]|nr:trypsin-like peptidase domain-containing protein [Candidatus Neomarinimicrobiota bacterium]
MIINYGKYILPLFAAIHENEKSSIIVKFLGCSFFINNSGQIATCAHVVKSIQDDEYVVAKYFESNKFYKLYDIRVHPKHDFATANLKIDNKDFFPFYIDDILICMDVGTFGFTAAGIDKKNNVKLDARFLKGYISRIADNFENLPNGTEALETSFPSLAGFSGSPIISSGKVVGMLFNNYESQVIVHSYSEVVDENERFSEKITKIVEMGLAYTSKTILRCLQQF